MHIPAVYILANQNKTEGALYTGVTSNLIKRIFEHKNHITKGFTARYNCTELVFFEMHNDISNAILRKKQIKAGSREKKIQLIASMNPKWCDLYDSILSHYS